MRDDARADALCAAIDLENVDAMPLSDKEQTALHYARRLVRTPWDMVAEDLENLRLAGWEDGEIREINQVTAYFCYANRTVLRLGCSTRGARNSSATDGPEASETG